jgi:hypothetical protein
MRRGKKLAKRTADTHHSRAVPRALPATAGTAVHTHAASPCTGCSKQYDGHP